MHAPGLFALLVSTALFTAACKRPPGDDDRLFVPESVPNLPKEGEVGVTLKLGASTLVAQDGRLQLFAAVKNIGNSPRCNSGMDLDFLDKDGQVISTVATALMGQRLYRLDAATVVRCIDPDRIGMAVAKVPQEVELARVASMRHTFPTFGLEGIAPLEGLELTAVKAVPHGTGGGTYKGTLTNKLPVPAKGPSIVIFPLNRAGRPLGAATTTGADIPAGGSWTFETSAVPLLGASEAAYPVAALGSN